MLRGYSRKNRKNSRKSKGEQGTINIKLLLYELGDLKILGRGVEISSPDLFVQIKIGYFSVWETLNRVHSLQYGKTTRYGLGKIRKNVEFACKSFHLSL